MTQRIALLSLLTLLTLAACGKPPAAPKPADDDEDSDRTPSAAAKVEQQQPPPPMDRAVKAAGMMQLIDPSPQCQQYRDQLEQAGKVPADQPLPVEMSKIVSQANDAGCVIKHQK